MIADSKNESERILEAAYRSERDIIALAQARAADLIEEHELASAKVIIDAKKEADVIIINADLKNKELDSRAQEIDDQFALLDFAAKNADLITLEAETRSHKLIDHALNTANLILEEANSKTASITENSLSKIKEATDVANKLIDTLALDAKQKTSDLEELKNQYTSKKEVYDKIIKEISIFDERLSFAETGFYEPHFEFTDSEQFKTAIQEVRSEQKDMISAGTAAFCDTTWTVDGSAHKGDAMTKRNIKLTLRAFNGECDAAISNVRWNNVNSMLKRISNAHQKIDKLNKSNKIYISEKYLELKIEELRLTHEYREKQKQEREERAEFARAAREEQALIRDMEEAEQEEEKYREMLEMAKREASGADGLNLEAYTQKISALEKALSDAHVKVARAQSMAEMTKSGWVYIISNVGSFGHDVVKIGLTRRLDPTDRVRELGAASVPFRFDTHAMIYSDDAPTLERSLHLEFSDFRVNTSNMRKEFFRVSIDDVEAAIKKLAPDATFFKDIEAQEYHETLALRNARLQEYASRQEIVFPYSL